MLIFSRKDRKEFYHKYFMDAYMLETLNKHFKEKNIEILPEKCRLGLSSFIYTNISGEDLISIWNRCNFDKISNILKIRFAS